MKTRNLTLQDATKEELIEYFFMPEDFGGGYRIPASKDRFLLWLKQKRTGKLLTIMEASQSEAQSHLNKYLQYVKEANDEPDINRKLDIFEKANEEYRLYERCTKAYEKYDCDF